MTERKRASGFVLMDAAFTSDAKFRRLDRQSSSPAEYSACVGVYWILLADCRRAKSPAVDWEDYSEYDVQIGLLRSVGLLNEEGFDPEPFERWAPAYRSVSERTPGTKGTQSTNTSGQVISGQVPSTNANGSERAREGEPQSFMAWKPKIVRPTQADVLADIKRQHDEAFEKTAEVARLHHSEKEGSA